MNDNKFEFYDEEEKELIESYERGEWKPVDNPTEWDKKLKEVARNYRENKKK